MKKEHMSPYALRQYAAKKAKATKESKPTKTKAAKKGLVKLIKQVVAREDETKFRSELISNAVTHNSQISNADIIRLLPKLVQDQGQGASYERMGIKVSPRSLQIDADICLTDVDRSMAIVVHYWVLTTKNIKSTSGLSGVPIGSNLLMAGDSTETQGFNGYTQDAMLPVNKTYYNVLKRGSFLLAKNTGTVQDSTTSGNQPLIGSVRHRLAFKLKTPSTFVYEQDSGAPRLVYFPSGYAPFIVFGYHHQNQTVPDVNNRDITVTLRSSLYYDDA